VIPKVVIEGVDETARSLDTIADKLDGPVGAWGAVEAVVLSRAQALAPKRSGRLAASGRKSGTPAQAAVSFGGAQVPYANPIHWGWPAHRIKAQPFLSRAVDQTEPAWRGLYESRMATMIEREAG
jgi:hypothetical protein